MFGGRAVIRDRLEPQHHCPLLGKDYGLFFVLSFSYELYAAVFGDHLL